MKKLLAFLFLPCLAFAQVQDVVIDGNGTLTPSASTLRSALSINATTVPSTATGSIAATDVQAAIAELASEKIQNSGSNELTNNATIRWVSGPWGPTWSVESNSGFISLNGTAQGLKINNHLVVSGFDAAGSTASLFNGSVTLGDGTGDDTTINDDDPRAPNLTSTTYNTAADDKVLINGNVADARYGAIIFRTKAADTSRASTTTLTADPDFQFPYTAGTWQVDIYVRVNAGTTGGLKVSAGGGLSVNAYGEHRAMNRATSAIVAQGVPDDVIQATGWTSGTYRASILFTATGSGTYSLNWSQSVSDATNTTFLAGSSLVARKVN